MVIDEMRRDECVEVLARNRLGHLACSLDGQPYVVPVSYAFDGRWLYGISTAGRKMDWLRRNPRACVEVEELGGPGHWSTVVVLGKFEELIDLPDLHDARNRAYELLSGYVGWWEGAYGHHRDDHDDLDPIYFRISLDSISGRRAASPS